MHERLALDRIVDRAVEPEHELWTVTPLDEAYPARLAVLGDRPPVLYGWGDPAVLTAPASVAVVGTRRPSPAGRLLTGRIATRLVELGVSVVSGLAVGIDGAAHAATLAAGGRTLAVIGAGHRHPGARAHRGLLPEIVRGGGAVVSELAPPVAPTRGTFPRRNRLLAALSDAVAVVEALLRSGAINTTHHALEQGRPLFVAPGRPGEPTTAGCLRLLRETEARLYVGLDELVEDLGPIAQPPAEDGRAVLGAAGGAAAAVAE